MDLTTVIGLTGIAVNLLAMVAVLLKWARWSGVVDTKIDDMVEHIKQLPCRQCRTFAKES